MPFKKDYRLSGGCRPYEIGEFSIDGEPEVYAAVKFARTEQSGRESGDTMLRDNPKYRETYYCIDSISPLKVLVFNSASARQPVPNPSYDPEADFVTFPEIVCNNAISLAGSLINEKQRKENLPRAHALHGNVEFVHGEPVSLTSSKEIIINNEKWRVFLESLFLRNNAGENVYCVCTCKTDEEPPKYSFLIPKIQGHGIVEADTIAGEPPLVGERPAPVRKAMAEALTELADRLGLYVGGGIINNLWQKEEKTQGKSEVRSIDNYISIALMDNSYLSIKGEDVEEADEWKVTSGITYKPDPHYPNIYPIAINTKTGKAFMFKTREYAEHQGRDISEVTAITFQELEMSGGVPVKETPITHGEALNQIPPDVVAVMFGYYMENIGIPLISLSPEVIEKCRLGEEWESCLDRMQSEIIEKSNLYKDSPEAVSGELDRPVPNDDTIIHLYEAWKISASADYTGPAPTLEEINKSDPSVLHEGKWLNRD